MRYWIVKLQCQWEDEDGRWVTVKERVRARDAVTAGIAALQNHKGYKILEVNEA